jgi:O-6-methylguanine DNA methyltransferase
MNPICCTDLRETAHGYLGLVASTKGLRFVTLNQSQQAALEAVHRHASNPIHRSRCSCSTWFDGVEQAAAHPQLAGSLKIPLDISGTNFQLAIWKVIASIPAGSVMTYGELAKKAGYPGAARAAGSACGANPIPMLIPCHRVVAQNGLGGFGLDLALKRRWLAQEGIKSF